jgi:hypothetical protein
MIPLLAAAALMGAIVDMRVDTRPASRLNAIRPLAAIGAGVDSDPPGKIPLLYSPARTHLALDAGLGALSYRLYTELSVQDWHWNPLGSFSDAQHGEGYWTSDASKDRAPLVDSWGYRLPHRGNTRDQGDDNGYSRIDDGDLRTYWKSDPYLTRPYTHEDDAFHPQWIVVDLGRRQPIDAIRIAWTNPYATRYFVEYWTGGDAILEQGSGTWHSFAAGAVRNARNGIVQTRLASELVAARFVRVIMTASSGTCDSHGAADRRNCLGYAVRELGLGNIDAAGGFHDLMHHSRCGGDPLDARGCTGHQTAVYVSSIDPWHRTSDRVRVDQDQPGLDVVTRSGFARGRPVMYPVAMLYSTPGNAVAEVEYLRARGYAIAYVELGEEGDGQYVTPEDYGALYVQWARALHAFDPTLKLGGPAFQGVNQDIAVWRDSSGDVSWLHRFLRYLKRHDALPNLAFMSFEHYPFHGCDAGALLHEDLLSEPNLMRGIVKVWRADGVPMNVPLFITEANFAADTAPPALQIEGALWMADWIASALSAGVTEINYYQYEAEPLNHARRCNKWGAYSLFITDARFHIRARAAQFYAAQMLTRYWLAFGDGLNGIYPATTSETPEVTAYAASRPDKTWSVMLVNKDTTSHPARLTFRSEHGTLRDFTGPVTMMVFGRAQYNWSALNPNDNPYPNTPPKTTKVASDANRRYMLPPESIVVLRGRVTPP